VDVFGGLKPDGWVLINTSKTMSEMQIDELFDRFDRQRFMTVSATELAREHLGKPLPNAALLGGFAALTEVVTLGSVTAAIRERFAGAVGEANAAAAEGAFALVGRTLGHSAPQIEEHAHA
jgi:pyruvate ferredoxin oxidoreductase gamma subunit